jgi:hypothetical protein
VTTNDSHLSGDNPGDNIEDNVNDNTGDRIPWLDRQHTVWMLSLVLPFRGGKLLCGLLISVALWLLMDQIPGQVSFYLKLFLVGSCAYIVPVFIHVIERTVVAFDKVAPLVDAEEKELLHWRRSLTRRSRRWIIVVSAVSVFVWLVHSYLLELSFGSNIQTFFRVGEYGTIFGTLLVWVFMNFALTALYENASSLARLSNRLNVDLLRGTGQVELARVAVISMLSVIGAQSLFVLLVIDANANWVAILPGFIVTTIPMLALFFIPVWPMHRRLKNAKEQELHNIDTRLTILRPGPETDFDDGPKMDQLNVLLNYRREIRQVSEWPFNVPVLIRLGLYLVLPPLTWVGAALIENVVDSMI